jgi:hypothetical protein
VAWFRDPRGALYRLGQRSEGSGKEEWQLAVGFQYRPFLKPKRRGREDAQAPLDEGNRGGTCGASLPLPPSTGGLPMAAHGAAAPAGAVAAHTFGRRRKKEGRAGWAGMGRWPKRGGEEGVGRLRKFPRKIPRLSR